MKRDAQDVASETRLGKKKKEKKKKKKKRKKKRDEEETEEASLEHVQIPELDYKHNGNRRRIDERKMFKSETRGL